MQRAVTATAVARAVPCRAAGAASRAASRRCAAPRAASGAPHAPCAAWRPLSRRASLQPCRARGAPGTADGPDASPPEDGGIAGFDPMEEVGVPSDQRPVNELKALREDWLYSWAQLAPAGLLVRVGVLFGGVFALLGAPISNGTFDPERQLAEFVLAGAAGSLVVVTIVLVRTYLGWAYVGNRLLSAVVEYEETGWYDGQLFVKPPKVLARDRLLGAYEVKPVLSRLKGVLLGSGLTLAAVSAVLSVLISDSRDVDGFYGRGAGVAAGPRVLRDGISFRQKPAPALPGVDDEDEEDDSLESLKYNDQAANAEAQAIKAAIGNVPAYCTDRYYRAMAGRSVDCEMLQARFRSEGKVGFEE